MALKRTLPEVRFGGFKVSPDELDQNRQYMVINPTITDTFLGTVESATAAAFVFTNTRFDYPRNVLFTALGVAGGMGGTATVTGKDQFGNTISETMNFGSAAGGGTVAGTKIFSQVTAGTFTPVGLGGTAIGTAKLGAAKGTAVGIVNLFGLPDKIASTGDVKTITWINNGVVTALTAGTISNLVGTANHTFKGTAVVAATDTFVVNMRSSFNSEDITVQKL